jgi:hypothetical protein
MSLDLTGSVVGPLTDPTTSAPEPDPAPMSPRSPDNTNIPEGS